MVDAETLANGKSKSADDKQTPGMKYLKAASDAVAAAHKALSKAAELGGFGKLPQPNYEPLDKGEKDAGLAKKYTQAANEAVNAAEKALDNLSAIGYPDVLPAVGDASTKSQKTNTKHVSKKHSLPSARIYDDEKEIGEEVGSGSGESEESVEEDENPQVKSIIPTNKDQQGEFIEAANRAVDEAHEALVNAELKLPDKRSIQ